LFTYILSKWSRSDFVVTMGGPEAGAGLESRLSQGEGAGEGRGATL